MRVWFRNAELLCAWSFGLRRKSPACSQNLQFVWRCDYGVEHRQSDGEVATRHLPIHENRPNSGGGKSAVAITLRLAVGVKQSETLTLRETLGIPSGSGHDAVNPWVATSTVRLLNRTRLGMGAVTILIELCPIGSIVWLAYNRRLTER